MGTKLWSHLPFFIKPPNPPWDSFYPLFLYWGQLWGQLCAAEVCVRYKNMGLPAAISGFHETRFQRVNISFATIFLAAVIVSDAQAAKFIHVCSILRLSS